MFNCTLDNPIGDLAEEVKVSIVGCRIKLLRAFVSVKMAYQPTSVAACMPLIGCVESLRKKRTF